MNDDDLVRALGDIADDIRHGTEPLPVDRIVRRRRRRRAVVRGVGAGGALAAVGAVALVGAGVARWDPAPAAPDPLPTTAAPTTPLRAWPVCGDPVAAGDDLPLSVEVAAVEGHADGDVVARAVVTGAGAADLPAADPDTAVLAVLADGDDGHVVALLPARDAGAWGRDGDAATLALSGAPAACAGDRLPAGAYRAVVAVRTPDGVAVSDPVDLDVPPAATSAATSAARPLVDPSVDRFALVEGGEYAPDDPGPGDLLPDGDYFATVTGADPGARTVTVDVLQVRSRDEVVAAALAAGREDPDLPLGFLVENQSERLRTVPVAPDVTVVGSCAVLPFPEVLALDAGAEAEMATRCRGTAPEAPSTDFWVDVRDGVVVQLVGQFLP